eukprot:PLAT6740.1.p1 GENE.PLAT6740.1~~PLAT6740.1.p1  ORF type:complete len:627 (+),score=-54.84 PLAT6740.1:44-1882(+)
MGQVLTRVFAAAVLITVVSGSCQWRTVTNDRKPLFSGCVDSGLSIRSRTFLVPVSPSTRGDGWTPWTTGLCGEDLASKRSDELKFGTFRRRKHDLGHLIAASMFRKEQKPETCYLMNMWCEPAWQNQAVHSYIEKRIRETMAPGVYWTGVAALAKNQSGTLVDITEDLSLSKKYEQPKFEEHVVWKSVKQADGKERSVKFPRLLSTVDPKDMFGFQGWEEERKDSPAGGAGGSGMSGGDGRAAAASDLSDAMIQLNYPVRRAYAWWLVVYYPVIDESLCVVMFPYDGYKAVDCDKLGDVDVRDHVPAESPTTTEQLKAIAVRKSVYDAAVNALRQAMVTDHTLSFAYGVQQPGYGVHTMIERGEKLKSAEKSDPILQFVAKTTTAAKAVAFDDPWRSHDCVEDGECEWTSSFNALCSHYSLCNNRWALHNDHMGDGHPDDKLTLTVPRTVEGSTGRAADDDDDDGLLERKADDPARPADDAGSESRADDARPADDVARTSVKIVINWGVRKIDSISAGLAEQAAVAAAARAASARAAAPEAAADAADAGDAADARDAAVYGDTAAGVGGEGRKRPRLDSLEDGEPADGKPSRKRPRTEDENPDGVLGPREMK